ncbi:MAG: DUF4097 family beta strand repeat-containing protein [Clostridia bacterium]|nr:DUF4097 family beta strand repeat-containing protein [Clostridia bacterium]
MRKKDFLSAVVLCFIFFTSCSSSVVEMGPKKEVAEHIEKTIEIKEHLDLFVDADSSNIEFYTWDKGKVKFEIKNRVRGMGEKKELESKLKNFDINLSQDGNMVVYKARYGKSIKSHGDISSDIRIFIPKNAESVGCKVGTGTIKVLDDLKSSLNIEVDMANIEVRRLEGKLKVKGDMGNLKVENGKIRSDSKVSVNFGNIDIKAEFEERGNYVFETRTGNIDLQLPEESRISFENMGTVEVNDFTDKNYPAKIKTSTDMGRITIKKYKFL